MTQAIGDRLKRLATAGGYQEGARKTAETATGLEAAVILLENMGDSEPSPELAARFEEAGLTGTVDELRTRALGAVGQKAAMERSIADGMTATGAEELRRAGPPPPPGPPPEDLGHPEGGGLGPLTR